MEWFDLDFTSSPYRMAAGEKDCVLTQQMNILTDYHRAHCPAYDRMLSACGILHEAKHYSELPYLPVGLFKRLTLESVSGRDFLRGETQAAPLKHAAGSKENGEADSAKGAGSDLGDSIPGVKTVTSSGTSGQQTSQIILDGETRAAQQQALAAIVGDFLGKKRIPMLVIDCPATVKKRDHFSARTTGILGFTLFGTHRTFALQDDLSLDVETIHNFLDRYGGQPFFVFGFTFLVWKYFCLELERQDIEMDFSNGILIHGGGWKKLAAEAVSEETFRSRLRSVCGLTNIHDYYGMAEQTGSIFMECECGHLHASDYSGVLVRRAKDFSLCEIGEPGIIQVLSVLPKSYPGHSLLTEDEGVLLGVDDCPCGRKGAYFKVNGRLKNAELRGCSDTLV